MQVLKDGVDLEAFFASLARGPAKACLILDYDGTLAPFREARDEAFPYPGVREALKGLLEGGLVRVVILSGRAVADLLPLLGLERPPEIWGSHGWERRLADGRYTLFHPGDQAKEGLAAAGKTVIERWATQFEPKPCSIAFHIRGMEARAAASVYEAVLEAWGQISRDFGLETLQFDGGVELRVPGRDKGSAVGTLLGELGAGAVVAVLGDDRTDEDAFRAIEGHGLGVLVREELRPTAAQVWIRPPGELLEFLKNWERQC